jgi:3',5'-nucleoside bisphosphate phosphatase
MSADLHLHTYYSDGCWSPQQLIDEAAKLDFECIAITDHDTVAALKEAHACAEGRIRLIDGIELNTIWINPDGEPQNVHILGYFINPDAALLQEIIRKQQAARLNYLNETLERLRSCGHMIHLDQVKAAAGRGSIGRPHICAAMVNAGICSDTADAYRMLTRRDSKAFVVRRSISPEAAIAAIAAAGGISSLAHPGKDAFMQLVVKELAWHGLNAIEAYHSGHTSATVRRYLKMARKRHLLVTGGSDCHGPFENYPASIGTVRLAGELVLRLEKAHKQILEKNSSKQG